MLEEDEPRYHQPKRGFGNGFGSGFGGGFGGFGMYDNYQTPKRSPKKLQKTPLKYDSIEIYRKEEG